MADFTGAGTPLTRAGVTTFAGVAGAGEAEMWSVLAVETTGCGFLPDRRPKILFERHKFHAFTGGVYDLSHPDISAPTAGGYGRGDASQYSRLAEAISLDRNAALRSTSWGIGQIMGFNFAQAGFANVEAMVAAMVESEDNQIGGMASFLAASSLAAPLAAHDWTSFALGYNGPSYARNNYDGLLAQFYHRFSTGPLPDLQVRTAQLLLTYKGFDPRGVDGVLGPGTQSALRQFQAANGLAETGKIDAATLTALQS